MFTKQCSLLKRSVKKGNEKGGLKFSPFRNIIKPMSTENPKFQFYDWNLGFFILELLLFCQLKFFCKIITEIFHCIRHFFVIGSTFKSI